MKRLIQRLQPRRDIWTVAVLKPWLSAKGDGEPPTTLLTRFPHDPELQSNCINAFYAIASNTIDSADSWY